MADSCRLAPPFARGQHRAHGPSGVFTEATVPYLRNINGKFCLDQIHDYYYQVQGQMFCCNRKQCHFVIYTFEDIKVIMVKRDDVFIQGMLEKLTSFYNNYFRRELLDKFYYRRTHQYVFE